MIYFYCIELRHVCSNSDDCDDGMLCAHDTNNTKSAFGNRNPNQPQVCLCNGDEGYAEDIEDNNCNGKHRERERKRDVYYVICSSIVYFVFGDFSSSFHFH